MSKGKGKEKPNRDTEKSFDGMALMPAALLCAVIVIMTLLDVLLPMMEEKQYVVFPLLIRLTSAVSLVCAAAYTLKQNGRPLVRRDAGQLCLGLFLVCIMISTAVNGFSRSAALGVAFRYIGIFDMITMVAAYLLLSSRIEGVGLRKKVLLSYMTAADLLAVAFILDWQIGISEAFRNKNEPSAIFFHGNHYGYFLVMAVIISAGFCIAGSGKTRVFGMLSLALNTAALLMNRSMGCLLAVAAVFVIAFIALLVKGRLQKRTAVIILAVTAGLSAAALAASSALRSDVIQLVQEVISILSGTQYGYMGHGRLGLWECTIDLIKERPLTGFGCEGISEYLKERFSIANPHNEPLTYAAYYGIPAACFYLAGVALMICRGIKTGDEISVIAACAAAGYFISSLFGVAMFYTLPFFFVMLGLTYGERSKGSEKIR